MLLLSIALAASASVQTPPPSPPTTIVVTGRRPTDYRAALEACLARNCPPNEDIDATMALAESLFIEGQYREARRAILRSISRNHDEARNYPEPVSDLYRANARVARNLGLDRQSRFAMAEILETLQTGIPVEDHRHFTARFELAQTLIAFGEYRYAHRVLDQLIDRARAVGRDDVVARAELRQMWIQRAFVPRGSAPSRELLELARSTDPIRSIGARQLLVRIYAANGNTREAERMIAELGRTSGRRQLLVNPDYELLQRDDVEGNARRAETMYRQGTLSGSMLFSSNLAARMLGSFEDQWIDVAFWIKPDGRVEGLEIVRRRGDVRWTPPLLTSIRGRIYAPSEASTYRLERYTYTAGYDLQGSGTRTSARTARARVEYFDLSGTAAAAPAAAPAETAPAPAQPSN
jgi:hypothetical protein